MYSTGSYWPGKTIIRIWTTRPSVNCSLDEIYYIHREFHQIGFNTYIPFWIQCCQCIWEIGSYSFNRDLPLILLYPKQWLTWYGCYIFNEYVFCISLMLPEG